MEPTTLIYSSHDRCNYIHNDWIVQRALRGNKHILFLTMSEGRPEGDGLDRQEYSWSRFEWFFDYYRPYGLVAIPFFWRTHMRKEDVDMLMRLLSESEVVILGGGNPARGMWRYRKLGEWYYGDPELFSRILHERQARGLLTVGYSAGVDQLCQYMTDAIDGNPQHPWGFGLARNLMALSHFEHGPMEGVLYRGATRFGHCMVFGLPNDSGIAVSQGMLPSGLVFQIIHFITDNSWDVPHDQFHIKTRQGTKIQHYYPDGRHWAFNGGDTMVRLQSPDASCNEAFILPPGGPAIDYWTQEPVGYVSIGEILRARS